MLSNPYAYAHQRLISSVGYTVKKNVTRFEPNTIILVCLSDWAGGEHKYHAIKQ